MRDTFNPAAKNDTAPKERAKRGGIFYRAKRLFADSEFFTALLLVVISLVSFGLGRLSAGSESLKPAESNEAASSVVVTKTQATSSDIYVGSVNSDKYHLPWCSGAQRINEENKIVFESKSEAEAAGYVPAGNCKGI